MLSIVGLGCSWLSISTADLDCRSLRSFLQSSLQSVDEVLFLIVRQRIESA
jgi:hypothetical protein